MVDIDSTLYPSEELWIRFMREVHGIELRRDDIDEWDFYRRYGVSDADFGKLIREHFHATETILSARPYVGAAEQIAAWRSAGHRIHIVSDRDEPTVDATVEWLRRNHIGYDALELAARVDKFAYVCDQDIPIVVDDKPTFLEQIVQSKRCAATIELPYNIPVLQAHPEIVSARTWRTLGRRMAERFGI